MRNRGRHTSREAGPEGDLYTKSGWANVIPITGFASFFFPSRSSVGITDVMQVLDFKAAREELVDFLSALRSAFAVLKLCR